jgi:hypothetical protein
MKLKVNGVEYPFPSFDTLTYGDAKVIKRYTEGRLVLGELYDAMEKGDPDAMLALAAVALSQNGVSVDPDELTVLPLDAISIVFPDAKKEEHEPGSPLDEKQPESENENGSHTNSNVVELSGS